MKAKHIFTALSLAVLATACKRDYEPVQQVNADLSNRAFLKVVNNTVNSSRMILFVDGMKMSGTLAGGTNPNISYNSATFAFSNFPQSFGGYLSVSAGQHNFVLRDTAANTTLRPVTIDAPLAAGTYYSIYTADSVNNSTGQLVQDDNFNSFDTAFTRIRFAHMAYAPGNAPNVVFGTRRLGTLFNNVTNKTLTNFIDYKANSIDSVYVVRASNLRDTLLRQAFSFMANRPYTIVFRGRFNLTTAYSATNFFGRRMELVAQDRFPL